MQAAVGGRREVGEDQVRVAAAGAGAAGVAEVLEAGLGAWAGCCARGGRGSGEEAWEDRGRGRGFGLALEGYSARVSAWRVLICQGCAYGSERLLARGSSASSASSSLGESSTAGCLPFSGRLDDASAWPCGDGLAGELDIPSASVQ